MKYDFIETIYFKNQVLKLSKSFIKVEDDINDFKKNFDLLSGVHLGEGVYKFRYKNSSIPTGKSGGFRIILKIFGDKVLPLLIYSKTNKSNVSKIEILEAIKKSLD